MNSLELVKDFDDLSDVVPSAKFFAEFPDGKIPMLDLSKLVPYLRYTDDTAEALERMLREFDKTREILRSLTAAQVFDKIEQYEKTDRRNFKARKALLVELLIEGLSIRILVKLVPDKNPERILGLLLKARDDARYTPEQVESIYLADEMMMEGAERGTIREVTGINGKTLICLERLGRPCDSGYEGAMKIAFEMMMGGATAMVAHRFLITNFHDVASSINYNTVYSLMRKSRLARNMKRFDYKETE